MHVAQINVGRLVAPIDDPRVAGFATQLDPINALAEQSPGFVWRLVGDGNDATDLRISDDPLLIVNMSVWESVEALRNYVYRSAHAPFLRDRHTYFERPTKPIYALWWVPVGHIPTVEEGIARLEHLRTHGPSDVAFWFPRPAPPPPPVVTP